MLIIITYIMIYADFSRFILNKQIRINQLASVSIRVDKVENFFSCPNLKPVAREKRLVIETQRLLASLLIFEQIKDFRGARPIMSNGARSTPLSRFNIGMINS